MQYLYYVLDLFINSWAGDPLEFVALEADLGGAKRKEEREWWETLCQLDAV